VIGLVVPWLDHFLKGEPGAWSAFTEALGQPGIVAQQSCTLSGTDEPDVFATDGPRLLLGPARPNPFFSEATIEYRLPRAGVATIAIFAPSGRRIRLLAHEEQAAGPHRIRWDGRDEHRVAVPAGIYWCRVRACGEEAALRLLELR